MGCRSRREGETPAAAALDQPVGVLGRGHAGADDGGAQLEERRAERAVAWPGERRAREWHAAHPVQMRSGGVQDELATAGGVGGTAYRPGGGVYRSGTAVLTVPRLLREVTPQYTDEAMRAGIQGTVWLEVVVLPNGTVGDVTPRSFERASSSKGASPAEWGRSVAEPLDAGEHHAHAAGPTMPAGVGMSGPWPSTI